MMSLLSRLFRSRATIEPEQFDREMAEKRREDAEVVFEARRAAQELAMIRAERARRRLARQQQEQQ